jgi:uncharacterized protein (TIGR03435 family)
VKPARQPLEFAVASGLRYFRISDSRLEASNKTLAVLISFAYDIPYERISAPAWMSQDYFQIMATLPLGSTKADVPAMLQNLLKDRFKLRTHREHRLEAVYELILDQKGSKLRSSLPGVSQGCYGWPGQRFCPGSTIGQLADFISGKISAGPSSDNLTSELEEHTIDRPVIDQTGLTGTYDIDLQWLPPTGLGKGLQFSPANRPPRDASVKADSIFGALESVGLRLHPAKHSFDILVIDHAERLPSGN